MEDTIKIFALRCSDKRVYKGRLEYISNTLRAKQKFVGGTIQCISLGDGLDLICNDDGKILGLPPNRAWVGDDGQICDIIVGNCIVCRHQGAEFTSINDEDVEKVLKILPALSGTIGNILFISNEDELPDFRDFKEGDECVFTVDNKNIKNGKVMNRVSEHRYKIISEDNIIYEIDELWLFENKSKAEEYLRRYINE